jgi:NAD(P)-dependent dehydrogenase (short-subunit alcohol dehydrogenase family)
MNLAGTTVLVTGATDGIGRATAFRLAPLVGRPLVHELDDLNLSHHEYSAVGAYARSKLAVVTWTCAVAGAGAEAVSVHPGVISTGLLHAMFSVGGDTVEHAAGNVVHAVQSEAGNGQYVDERVIADPNPFALDLSAQARLARATEELIA